MAKQEQMGLLEFMEKFKTDDDCRKYLYKKRFGDGFVCPKCGEKREPFHIVSRHLYQCKNCNHQTSVTAGTVMDHSKTSLTKWFLAIYLMSTDKRGCSALQIQKQCKINRYDTAWLMTHKIKQAMSERDKNYKLSGRIEVDESFFGATHEGSKPGRGTDKTPVVFGLSLNSKGHPIYLRAKIVENVDSEEIIKFANECIEKGSTIISDGLSPYLKLKENGFLHESAPFDLKELPEHLKWIHRIIGNAKSYISGTFHGLSKLHLKAFLDEFCYRFNRRFYEKELFARTVFACVKSSVFTRKMLVMS
jgi:transposase-like protein